MLFITKFSHQHAAITWCCVIYLTKLTRHILPKFPKGIFFKKKKKKRGSPAVVQWDWQRCLWSTRIQVWAPIKDLALPQLWTGSDPWSRNSLCRRVAKRGKKKKWQGWFPPSICTAIRVGGDEMWALFVLILSYSIHSALYKSTTSPGEATGTMPQSLPVTRFYVPVSTLKDQV